MTRAYIEWQISKVSLMNIPQMHGKHMPHQSHLGNSSSNFTFSISDNHGEQIYFCLAVLSCLTSAHVIWEQKSNFRHKFITQLFSLNKESYKIIQNNNK